MKKKTKKTASKSKKPKKADSWGTVILHFGYVESARVSPMVFTNLSTPAYTKVGAIKDLARWFLQKWMEDHEYGFERAECCTETLSFNLQATYCVKCGTMLSDSRFDVEQYQDWLVSCQGHAADGFGWDGEGLDWSPWSRFEDVLASDHVVVIKESAEKLLTYAIPTESLPDGIKPAIDEFKESILKIHAENRLRRRNLDIDGLIDYESAAIR